MMRHPTLKYGRSILWFVVVLLISLAAADLVIVSQQRRLLKDIWQNDAQNELDLMGSLIQDAMLKYDYDMVESFFIKWGKEHKDVLEIKAFIPNKTVLKGYKSPLPMEHFIRLQRKVSYEGKDLITLELIKDFSSIEKSLDDLSFKLVGGSIIFIALLGFFLWYTVNRTAMKPLEKEISERKKAEEKLKLYASELKQSNEDVLSFAYIVSHDLRAPLVSIKGFVGELQFALKDIGSILDRCMPHLDEKERTQLTAAIQKNVPVALNFIGSSVSRMDGLINAVLTLSRLGHRELKPEPVDVKEVITTILSSLEHQIEQRKTVVTLGELPMITADKFAMGQIMGNLIDNALKYLEQGREGRIVITAEQGAHEMTFHISDNGCGIAPEDLHKVFEIFRRVGKQDVPGEGMGLAYVKALVRKQGGRIWCESEPGKGSIFNVAFPFG